MSLEETHPCPSDPHAAVVPSVSRHDHATTRRAFLFTRTRFEPNRDALRHRAAQIERLSSMRVRALFGFVSADQIIREIQHLTPTEQAEVIQFAYRLDAERMLSGKELVALAKKMVAAADPTAALEIREQMIRGFYGGKRDA
ncbi:MAG: hypothetical protein M3R59_06175 [Verrucomicrobiota bacterium]|nr:hypothetical protein [Verrucomicrobiota bacterium]